MSDFTVAGEQDREILHNVANWWHGHINPSHVALIFKLDENWKSLASISKITGKLQPLVPGYKLVLTIKYDEWQAMTYDQKKALLDHELCHVSISDNTGDYKMVGHDLEEFTAVVQRHGLWEKGVEKFMQNTKQVTIEEFAGEKQEQEQGSFNEQVQEYLEGNDVNFEVIQGGGE